MITLADATGNVRLIAKILAGVIALVLLGVLVFQLVSRYIESRRPAEAPAQAFGELPPIAFPPPAIQASAFSYRVNTLDGKLPALPDRLPVFKTFTPSETLLSLQEGRDTVQGLGYSTGEARLDKTLYQWSKPTGEIIKYNVLTNNFDIFSSALVGSPSATFEDIDGREIASGVITLASQLGVDTNGLVGAEESAVTAYTLRDSILTPIEDVSDANVARVDLFQKPISVPKFSFGGEEVEKIAVVYSTDGKSTMNFFVIPGRVGVQVAEAHFIEYPITSESSDYPIKTMDQARKDLEGGSAYIAKYDPAVKQIDITSVELGYFMGSTDVGYAMPVVRFKGKNFEAYVDALNRTPPSPTLAK